MKHELLRDWVSTPLSEREPKALCGGVMIRLDLSFFYRVGQHLSVLKSFRYDTPMDHIQPQLSNARSWVGALKDAGFGSGLRGSRAKAEDLIDFIDGLLARPPESNFSFEDYMSLFNAVNPCEIVVTSELSMADAYYVLEKAPYSTLALVTEGEKLFPPSLFAKVPEAAKDMKEAGKCLAFEVPTAAAFHIHRAVEAVLRRYWNVVAQGQAKPKQRNIGVYLNAMKRLKCGDEKVIAALSQMKDLHRNPIIHPDETLDMEEAIALAGIGNSVVAAMLKEIPDVELSQPELPGIGALSALSLTNANTAAGISDQAAE